MARYYQKDKGTVINLDTGETAPPKFQVTSTSKQVYNPITGYMETPSTTKTTTRKGRPSPRTQGVSASGETFQKFGTQQLEYVVKPKMGTPFQGVVQKDTGKKFKGFTTSGYTGTKTTAFSQQFQAGITGVQKSVPRDVAIQMQKEKLEEMNLPYFPELPDLGDLFGNGNGNGNGNGDEEDCGWFGEKCWGNGNGNGEDCGWFGEKCWFKNLNLGWVKWVLLLIGIGVLLWLLRPLFGMIGAFKGGSP